MFPFPFSVVGCDPYLLFVGAVGTRKCNNERVLLVEAKWSRCVNFAGRVSIVLHEGPV
jgi:hypothetical protein